METSQDDGLIQAMLKTNQKLILQIGNERTQPFTSKAVGDNRQGASTRSELSIAHSHMQEDEGKGVDMHSSGSGAIAQKEQL